MTVSISRRVLWVRLSIALLVATVCYFALYLNPVNAQIVFYELRLPRWLTAIAVGSILSLSGVILQTVLANPLSEPYTLGIASGAALGAALTISFGGWLDYGGINLGAVLGAVMVMLFLLSFARKKTFQGESLILFGVMMSFFCSGLLAVWLAISEPVGAQSLTFWLLGDLSRVQLKAAVFLFITALLSGWFFYKKSKQLDAFLFGEEGAASFGVDPNKTQKQSIFLVSILVGMVVSAVGMIGFVGLVIPHFSRKFLGARHAALIPFSMVLGAMGLVSCDLLARIVSYPSELPVGAVTSILGAPVFMFLLMMRNKSGVRPL